MTDIAEPARVSLVPFVLKFEQEESKETKSGLLKFKLSLVGLDGAP